MAPRAATRVVFKNILFATDFSDASHRALLHALAMAKRYESKLTIVNVAPPETQAPIPMEPVPLEIDWQKQRAAECMARLEEFEPLRLFPHKTMLKQGNPWLEMLAIIEDASIDLVVVGTRGRGVFGTLVLGSVAEQILRHASCPVLTVGPEVTPSLLDHDRLSHILFATDFSEGSMHALRYALSLAEENDAELTLMHVLVEFQPTLLEYAKEFLADYRKRLWDLVPTDATMRCKVHVALETGAAAEAIVRAAHDRMADVIVMGVHSGGTVATHLPWTVIHSVVRHTRCPVLTTRGSAGQFIA